MYLWTLYPAELDLVYLSQAKHLLKYVLINVLRCPLGFSLKIIFNS